MAKPNIVAYKKSWDYENMEWVEHIKPMPEDYERRQKQSWRERHLSVGCDIYKQAHNWLEVMTKQRTSWYFIQPDEAPHIVRMHFLLLSD